MMALSGLDASTLDYHMSMLIRTMGTIRYKENIIKIKKKIFKSQNRNYFNKKNLDSLWWNLSISVQHTLQSRGQEGEGKS